MALSRDALRSHGSQDAPGALGPDATLNIMFPPGQTGLDNIEMVMLVPETAGAHDCQALAQTRASNRLYSLFIPKKGLRAGHAYTVVVSDAMGDQFEVGHIKLSGAAAQHITINAPMLTPGSPHYVRPASLPPG
jgi:hypothetical protein